MDHETTIGHTKNSRNLFIIIGVVAFELFYALNQRYTSNQMDLTDIALVLTPFFMVMGCVVGAIMTQDTINRLLHDTAPAATETDADQPVNVTS